MGLHRPEDGPYGYRVQRGHDSAPKGHSALQLSRDLDCQYKTAFVLSHKIREALAAEQGRSVIDSECAVDGAYFGGYVKPANRKEDRVDRRLAENQTGKRQVVIVARELNGETLTHVARSEAEGVPFVMATVAATITSRATSRALSGLSAALRVLSTDRCQHSRSAL